MGGILSRGPSQSTQEVLNSLLRNWLGCFDHFSMISTKIHPRDPLRQGGIPRFGKYYHWELGSHRPIFGHFWTPKRPGNYNPSDEKSCKLAHFEAPELSYPKITFLEHFWNLQNRSKSAPGAPKTRSKSSKTWSRSELGSGQKMSGLECLESASGASEQPSEPLSEPF